jgi:sensor histidine kinase YesM
MANRVFQHIIFWAAFVLMYAVAKMLFAGPTDLAYPPAQRFVRFVFVELAFLPWKALPFYFLFYWLVPRYFFRGAYLQMTLFFFLGLLVCLLGFRSMISPVTNILYGESPEFSVYSPERIFYSLTDLLPAIGLAGAAKLLKGRLTTQQRLQELSREKQAAELNFLKAQFNPHFLFNTLNNLYGMARKDAQETAPSILQLSNLMRYILQECQEPAIPIYKEIKVVEDFIDLQKLRYGGRLQVRFQQQVEDQSQMIAPLILLPFVENAFKHGAGESRFDFIIDMKLVQTSQLLHFYIQNPVESTAEEGKGGTGLQNVSRQLQLAYGSRHELNIQPLSGLFTVSLSINLNH